MVSIPDGPSRVAVTDCAYGLARYAAICQNAGLVPIVEPEILLDGDHDIDTTFEVASWVWAETFKYLADNNVSFERMLLKPSMVGPGADCPKRNTPEEVADATIRMLKSRVPPSTAGIMFLSGGLSELDSTLYLNAMNQSPNPWHVSFSYARALQNTVLKTWAGDDAKKDEAQAILARRAKENGMAQLGKFVAGDVSDSESESTYQKNYVCACLSLFTNFHLLRLCIPACFFLNSIPDLLLTFSSQTIPYRLSRSLQQPFLNAQLQLP